MLGFGDVDHEAADDGDVAMVDEGDDVANPEDAAVSGEHAVVEAVVAAGLGFFPAEVLGVFGVFGVEGTLPEAGLFPFVEGVAEQAFGVG